MHCCGITLKRPNLSEDAFRPGDRVLISAVREIGSARLLNGLTGEVVGPHPVANGWYKIRLDTNAITPHTDWSAPADRLTLLDGPRTPVRRSKRVQCYP